MAGETRASALNAWFHGLTPGTEPAGPDVGEAFRAGWDAHAIQVQAVLESAGVVVRAQGSEYGKAMLALVDALIEYRKPHPAHLNASLQEARPRAAERAERAGIVPPNPEGYQP